MLEKIQFLKDHRCFKKGDTFDFKKGVNLLVGEQGCGKSTILSLLGEGDEKRIKEDKNILRITADKTQTRWFDYEKHNPRIKSYIGTITDVASRFCSHGQLTKKLNECLIQEEENFLWLMDEPDGSLSIRSCLKLVELMKQSVEKGNQIIASVHSETVINCFENVLSLEHRKWISSKEFIESHKKA